MVGYSRDVADMPVCHVAPVSIKDSLQDVIADAVSRWRGNIPAARAEFDRVVAGIAITAIQECAASGFAGFAELVPDAPLKARDKEAIARILAEIIDAAQPRLMARCIDFAAGFGVQQGISQTDIGRIEGVSKALVSKICTHIKEDLEIQPARGMKSNAACRVYAVRQIGRRRERSPWRFRERFNERFKFDTR